MKLLALLITCFLVNDNTSHEQPGSKSKTIQHIASLFVGHWQGAGNFANGRKIAATVTFELSLDSCWIISKYEDIAPNHYKAISLWGAKPNRDNLAADCFDNFGGHRSFNGTILTGNRIVLVNHTSDAKGNQIFQRFAYEKLSQDDLTIAFETSRDSLNWQEVDHLLFSRVSK